MHARRALLLFAIVLGLAAITASFSRSDEESAPPPPPPVAEEPSVEPGTAPIAEGPATVMLEAGPRERLRIDAGRPASVEVAVDEPSLVEIPALGLSEPAEPLTPARFDILPEQPGRIEVIFTPADTDEPEPAGTLVVREPER